MRPPWDTTDIKQSLKFYALWLPHPFRTHCASRSSLYIKASAAEGGLSDSAAIRRLSRGSIVIGIHIPITYSKRDSNHKGSKHRLGINQPIFLHLWCITSGCSLLLCWLPGIELLNDFRVDTV